jgi:hypothetical protein
LPGVSIWSLRNELGDHAELPSSRPEQQTNAHTQRSVPTLARLQRVPAGILGGLAGRIGPCRRGAQSATGGQQARSINGAAGAWLHARKNPAEAGLSSSSGPSRCETGPHDQYHSRLHIWHFYPTGRRRKKAPPAGGAKGLILMHGAAQMSATPHRYSTTAVAQRRGDRTTWKTNREVG